MDLPCRTARYGISTTFSFIGARVRRPYLKNASMGFCPAYSNTGSDKCVVIRYQNLLKYGNFGKVGGAWVRARFISGAVRVRFPAVAITRVNIPHTHTRKTSMCHFPVRTMYTSQSIRPLLQTLHATALPILLDTKRVPYTPGLLPRSVQAYYQETDELHRELSLKFDILKVKVPIVCAEDQSGHPYLSIGTAPHVLHVSTACNPMLGVPA